MTKEQLLQAFEMKIDGFTYKQIGEALAYDSTHIYYSLSRICAGDTTPKRRNRREKYHFPKLKSAIFDNFSTVNEFCMAKDLPYTTVLSLLNYGHRPTARIRQLITERLGMPFEELFAE